MILFVDKLEKYDLGGFTTDINKAEYILAMHNLSFDKILSETPKTTKIPTGMFASGRYVVAFNISWDSKSVNMGFLNYNIDLAKHFNLFADAMSPKSIAGFHKFKENIKNKEQSELKKVELSDNDSDFVVAYGNFIEHHNCQ